ncbi:metallopeptidase family protein [Actinomycetaceae bacterium TAE3-ERU4]|nr:metallopeptidase family protein [Actinomycetaceae bacterium TAE3-ERU4]
MPPGLPGWITRKQLFDEFVIEIGEYLNRVFEPAQKVEFVVEEVPPSDPPPWERGAIRLGRAFGSDRRAGLPCRIVLYRLPILSRANSQRETAELLRAVMVENLAALFGKRPDEIDPNF